MYWCCVVGYDGKATHRTACGACQRSPSDGDGENDRAHNDAYAREVRPAELRAGLVLTSGASCGVRGWLGREEPALERLPSLWAMMKGRSPGDCVTLRLSMVVRANEREFPGAIGQRQEAYRLQAAST